jgi:ribosome-binding factor A
MRASQHKRDKYQILLRDKINQIIRSSFNDTRLNFVSVTKVELNNDYTEAKVFWDSFNPQDKDAITASLKKVAGATRSHLGRLLTVRQVPVIVFVYDTQFESEQFIGQLLQAESLEGRTF